MKSAFAASLGLLILSLFPAAQGYAEDSVKIAAIYALTGDAAEANAPSIQGVRIAVDEINERGGILGLKAELRVFDNKSTPIGSHLAAVQAAESGATAIIGAAWSSHSLPVAEVAQARQIPMISSFSTNPRLTHIGEYIFRVCFNDDFQGKALARFAREDLKAVTAGVLVNLTSDYSMGLSQIFQKHFEQSGGRVAYVAEYKQKQSDFEGQVRQALEAKADLLFLPGHDESGLIARLAQDMGVSSTILGGDGWSETSFLSRGGNRLKHAYYCSHWSESMDLERSRRFVSKYKGKTDLGVGTALAYDSVMLLDDAVRRAGSREKTSIRDALAGTRNFGGVTGFITFDRKRDPEKSVVIMEIRDGVPYYLKTLNP